MANFDTHSSWGMAAAFVVFGAAYYGLPKLGVPMGTTTSASLVGGIVTYLASIAPDIDHPQSIPARTLVSTLRIAALTGGIVFLWHFRVAIQQVAHNLSDLVAPQTTLGIIIGVVAIGVLSFIAGVDELVDMIAGEHRTRTHSIPGLVMASVMLIVAVWVGMAYYGWGEPTRTAFAVVISGGFFVGGFTHIGLLDGDWD